MVIILIGVSGSGKTTIGKLLASEQIVQEIKSKLKLAKTSVGAPERPK